MEKHKDEKIDEDPGWPHIDQDLAPKIPIKRVRFMLAAKRNGFWGSDDWEEKQQALEQPVDEIPVEPLDEQENLPPSQQNITCDKGSAKATTTAKKKKSRTLDEMFKRERSGLKNQV